MKAIVPCEFVLLAFFSYSLKQGLTCLPGWPQDQSNPPVSASQVGYRHAPGQATILFFLL